MNLLRSLLLLAIAAFGLSGILSEVTNPSVTFRFELTAGVGWFAIAIVSAGFLFLAIRARWLPLYCWYALPLIIGVGVGLLMEHNLKGGSFDLLSEFRSGVIGFAVALTSFAAFQYWADQRGQRDWYVLITLTGFLSLSSVVGFAAYSTPL